MASPVRVQARRQDHLERARREEEAPLLTAAYDQRLQVRWALNPRSTTGQDVKTQHSAT
jgi:hypothetical protein